MTTDNSKRPLIFIGGAPRAGTTVVHALICTASRTNIYHPEISFIVPLFNAYMVGCTNWVEHTNAFFAEPEHFDAHMRRIIDLALDHVSLVLRDPPVLTIKSPDLTPRFGWVHRLLKDRARFVTVIRHPYDVVRSRQEVIERGGERFDVAWVERTAREWNFAYRHLDDTVLAPAVYVMRYEDMLAKDTIAALRHFTGLDDISPDRVWEGQRQAQAGAEDSDPWFSPKYHTAIELTRRLSPLAPASRRIVDEVCAPMMKRFGYDAGGAN